MPDREKVIEYAEETLTHVLPDEKDTSGIMVKVGWIRDAIALLKEQEPKKEKAINYLLEIGWLQEHDAILCGFFPNVENQPCPPMPKAVKLK